MTRKATEQTLWLAVGTALGVGLGMLLAPVPGAVVRQKISDAAEDASHAITDRGQEFLDRGRELYEQGRQIADEAADMFEQGRKLVQG